MPETGIPDTVIAGLIGASASIVVALMVGLFNRGKTSAETESLSVQTALDLVATLQGEVDRLQGEVTALRSEVAELKASLLNEQGIQIEQEKEISALRLTITKQAEVIQQQGARIAALEAALRSRGVDPGEIEGHPI